MERSILKSVNKGFAKVSRVCLLSILFVMSFVSGSMAQSDDASLKNLKNNTAAGGKELERLRLEKLQHDEFMSYVYMSVGFAVVIAIAWSTTVMARNRNRRQNEEKQRFILRQQEKKHPQGHSHSHGHVKARR